MQSGARLNQLVHLGELDVAPTVPQTVRFRAMSLRAYLVVFALLAMLPMVLFVAADLGYEASSQRDLNRQAIENTTRALAAAVDREIGKTEATLQAIATSPLIDAGEFDALHAQAGQLAPPGAWITVLRPDGEQMLNTLKPFGAPLPIAAGMEVIRTVAETGRTVVSPVFMGALAKRLIVSVDVPVVRGGSVVYTADMSSGLERFNQLLLAQNLPEGWFAAIFDQKGVIVARSRDPDGQVGKPASPEFMKRIAEAPEGYTSGLTREGAMVSGAWLRLASGWTVNVAADHAVLEAPLQRGLLLVGGGALASLLMAASLAFVMGRRIAAPVRQLARCAQALGRGEDLPRTPEAHIAEVREVQHALVRAAETAREREQQAARLTREQSLREAAEAQSRSKDEFIAMLGHELRTPLAAISNAASLLEIAGPRADVIERARAVIGRQVRHLARLVDDLLDASRVAMGKVVLVRRPLDLGRFVSATMDAWRAGGRFKQHEVTVDTTSVWVDGDETRLEQIVTNLVGNALKYTPPGRSIQVRVHAHADAAVFKVEDTGIGMPSSLLDRAFDIFVQGERSIERSQGGLGLGLALTKALVEKHGGTVTARSAGADQGATFTVHLPRVAEPAQPDAASATAPRSASASASRRILVVEDSADARETLCSMLTLLGHEVHAEADGHGGLAAATAGSFDVALIDLGLPGLDGFELARRIRRSKTGRSTLLIAVTGYGKDDDRERALEAGFDAHLTKPVAVNLVLAAIAQRAVPADLSGLTA